MEWIEAYGPETDTRYAVRVASISTIWPDGDNKDRTKILIGGGQTAYVCCPYEDLLNQLGIEPTNLSRDEETGF